MFAKLKQSVLEKNFEKRLSKVQENRIVSQKEIQTVCILTTENISKIIDLQPKIESVLRLKNAKIFSFKEYNKTDEVSNVVFTEKDVNWKGEFVNPDFKLFLEQPFDLLIGYFTERNLHLEMAVLQSNASFKVGFSGVNANLYEIEINEKIGNTVQFSNELKKYLKILKKLKN